MAQAHHTARESHQSNQLLSAVAEHMKLPLLYMRQHAELVRGGESFSPDIIESAADAGMMLVDSYLYWQTIAHHTEGLDMEQASLTSLLYDVAHSLDKIAKSQNAQVQLDIYGRYGPVMTHPKTLHAAMLSLGLAYIEAVQDDAPVVLGVHKSRWGLVTGVYSENTAVTSDMLTCAKQLSGSARQPMPATSHTSMSGFIIADALLDVLPAKLRVAKHRRMSGLALTLAPNPQLALL